MNDLENFNEKNQEKQINYLGLSNQGATCYMNSLLQTLFMTPEFRKALYSWKFNENEHGKSEDNIPLQLQLIFAQLQYSSGRKSVNTKKLIHSFQWDNFESFQQHDVQEFCRVLFDAIEESCKETEQETFIRDLYEGNLINYVTCLKCKQESSRMDKFLDLSLTVKDQFTNTLNDSLEKALLSYIKPEFLEKENQYFCEKCNEKVDAVKGVRFQTLPKIITFQLNRFELDYESFLRKKINNKVTFPYILDMNELIKDYSEINQENILSNKNQQDLFQKVSTLVKDFDIYDNHQPGVFKDHILKNIKKGSNTYETFLEEVKNTPKIFDINNFQKKYVDDFKIDHENTNSSKKKVDFMPDPLSSETIFALKEEKKMLDDKLEKILSKQSFGKNIKKKQEKKIVDDIESDPLFGNSNIFSAMGENTQEKLIDKPNSSQENNLIIFNENELSQIFKELEKDVELYRKKGPYVYELFSIMMHSGGALRGHYYTFIKSFENGIWYNFNDSMVSKLRPDELKRSFGEQSPRYDSGVSAYMLFYRLCDDINEKMETPSIPEELMKIFREEEIEIKKREEIEENLRKEKTQQLNLKVFYKGKERMFLMKKTDKFSEFMQFVHNEMDIQEQPGDWRLRLYSYFEDIMQETFDKEKIEQTFDELKIKNFKNFIVETKNSYEEFQDYDPHKIALKINLWRENIESLEEKDLNPEKIDVQDDISLLQLLLILEEKFHIPFQNQILLKRTPFLSMSYSEIVNSNEQTFEKPLNYHKIFNGMNLFLECKDFNQPELCKWNMEFQLEKNRCFIKFNDPRKEEEYATFDQQIIIDNRKTFRELKEIISEKLKIPTNDFIMKRESKLGNEYKEPGTYLKDKLIAHNKIYLELGKPSKSGEYRLYFSLGSFSKDNQDTLTYEYEEIINMPVNSLWKVFELKQKLALILIEKKGENPAYEPTRLRLRERNSDKMGQILHNDCILKDYALYDKKAITIEILLEPEQTKPEDLLLIVKYWDIKKFELSGPKEIFMKKADRLKELGFIIEGVFGVNCDDIQACKINSLWSFNRGDLLNENWVDLKDNDCLIVGEPWYTGRDGALIIFRKRSEIVGENDKDLVNNLKNFNNNLKTIKKPLKIVEKEFKVNDIKEKGCSIKVKKKSEVKDDFDAGKKSEDKKIKFQDI